MMFFFPRYSWLIIFLSFAVTAFLTVGWFRVSVTEMQVLLLLNDAKSTALATQTVETLSEDIKTVAFFDQLVKEHPEQAEAWDQMTLAEKHTWWTSQITTERVKNSGIVKVTIFGNIVSKSQALADEVVDTLRAEPKRLYGESSAVGVSVLEEPFTETRLTDPFAWAIATASIGFLVSMILLWVFGSLQSMMNRSVASMSSANTTATPVDFSAIAGRYKSSKETVRQPIAEETPSTPIDPFTATREARSTITSELTAQKTDGVAPARLVTAHAAPILPKPIAEPIAPMTVTQTAPGNLPFIEGEFSWEAALPGLKNAGVRSTEYGVSENAIQETSTQPETVVTKDDVKPAEEVVMPAATEPVKPTEPTEEELKRRLNQLLRGEM
jgi:hypothetical protein